MDLMAWFLGLPPALVYAILFVVLVLEGTGMPGIPFEPVFLGAGALIGQGQIDLWLAVLVGSTGNLAGNLVGYWIGASPGRYLLRRFARRDENELVGGKWKQWMGRNGPVVIIISRWFGPIRTATILSAGATKMDIWVYTFYSAIGALTWTFAWQWAGWRLSGVIGELWQYFHQNPLIKVITVASGLIVVLAVVMVMRRSNPFRKPDTEVQPNSGESG